MAKKWKRWDDQGDLKLSIRHWIDKGRAVGDLVKDVVRESEGRWTDGSVKQAIKELLQDWLIVAPDGGFENGMLFDDVWLQVSEWSHDAIVKATKQGDYPGAIMFLFEKGVWHPDMERYGMTDDGEAASEEAKKAQAEAAAKMTTMPDQYDKVKRINKAQGDSMTFNEVPEGSERVNSAIQSASVEAFKDENHEFTIGEIMTKTKEIDPVAMAVELGDWITSNVEQFIDNRESVFRMYLSVKSDMGMPVSSLYQRLYLSIPDENESKGITSTLVDSLIEALDVKLIEAKRLLCEDKEFMDFLFQRMVYFYELTGFLVVDGKVQQALRQQMGGRVQINELVFDPISLTTTVAQGVGQHADGKVREGDQKVVVKKEVMPAGFGIEIEISVSPKNRVATAMY